MTVSLTLAIALLAAGPAAAEANDALPPEACVRLLREARLALLEGDRAGAWRRLYEAIESFPDEIVPVLAVLEHDQELELSPEATAEFRDRLVERLADAERPLPSSVLHYLVENPDLDEPALRTILPWLLARLERSPEDRVLLESVAVVQGRLEMYDAERATLGRLYTLHPSDEVAWECIRLDFEQEHWAAAVAMIERTARADGSLPVVARMAYIEALANVGRTDSMVEQIDALVEQTDSEFYRSLMTELLIAAAWGLRDAGEQEESRALFERVLDIQADHAEARLAMLHLYGTEEERQRHAAALEKSLAEEDDPHELADRGAGLLAAGNASGALGLLQRAADRLPDSESAWFNLGMAAQRLQKWELMDRALARAAALNPDRAETYLLRGAALQNLQRYEEAVSLLREALSRQPDLTNAHYYLYHCYRALGDDASAREALAKYNAAQ